MDDYVGIVDFFENLGKGHAVLGIAMIVVAVLICVVAAVSLIVSIVLSITYHKYNRRQNSANLTGEETARIILDKNGLQHIKVKVVGSLLFGNSYSHYFKKVRLRRRTRNRTSISALAMGAQKSALAVLDKEGDPDMKKRIKITPLITFGPFAFIPLVAVGILVDILLFNSQGFVSIIVSVLAVLFYLFSLLLSVMTLKTEKKAQERAYELLRENSMATEEEISQIRKLFKLYNIQYINDIILSALELLYYVLQIIASVNNEGSSIGSSND